MQSPFIRHTIPPHDTATRYRRKDGNQVKGFVANLTETCDKSGEDGKAVSNLITDTQVNPATGPDNGFFQFSYH